MAFAVDSRIGTELHGYRLEALVGRGGMGVVYRAHDPRLKRDVALKLLAPELAEDAVFRERFLTESELAAGLEHPNVVPIHDVGEVEGQLFVVMRLVEEGDLKALLAREGKLEQRRALGLVSQVAAALDAAHERGLVHRDVKPSNVLVDGRGHAYLADFGLSRRLSDQAVGFDAGLSLGTPAYVAPEQIEGKEVDGRADQYSLGCVLYECLAGERPFPRSSEAAVLFAHLEEAPPTLPGLEEVLPKTLAKGQAARYGSCTELADGAADALGITVRRRTLWPLAVAAVGMTVIAASLAAFFLTRGGDSVQTALPGADSLVRIDPATNGVTDTMPVGREASGVAASGRYVWVTNFADGNVWRIDARSHDATQIPVKGSPTGVAAAPGAVLVSDSPEHQLVSLDPDSGAVSLLTQLPGDGSFPVAAGGGDVWYADGTQGIAGTVVVPTVLPPSRVVVPADTSNLLSAYQVFDDVAVGAGQVWVVGDAFGRALWRLDPASSKVVATIPLPFVPGAVAAGEGAVWVTSLLGDTVSRIDPKTNRIIRTIPVGPGVNDVAVADEAVWATSAGDRTVTRIDPATNRVVGQTRLDAVPGHLTAGAGGIWVTTAVPTPRIDPGSIGIGVLADCKGATRFLYEDALAGAELALLHHGGRRGGPLLTDGIDGVRIGGRPVELAFGCTSGNSASTLAEARRLVEQAGVRILIGPAGGQEGLALQEYERLRPDVTFVNGSASSQQLDPPANFFSFHLDGAEWMAGLGTYAYKTLGWRRAAIVVDGADNVFNWTQAAGFVAEFCSLGGTIASRTWVPPGTQDYTRLIAGLPTKGVDGVVAATGAQTVLALARGYPLLAGRFGNRIVLGLAPSQGVPALGKRLVGAASGAPFEGRHDRFANELKRRFPQIKYPQALDLFYHDAMEATVQALGRAHGDLSGGQKRFRDALGRLGLRTAIGRIRLDRSHQAVGPNYILRIDATRKEGRLLRRVDDVEHTFGGYFKRTDPPPTRNSPACKAGNPPLWAR
jgi:DNA-binding beta-propeller fold protein YncE/ABC-type branched-subunit amino acid transport system substrate-binding protein